VHDAERRRPKWQLALELLDELVAWDLMPPVVLADAAYGEVSEFRLGPEQRELAYVVQVPGTISAYPEHVTPEQVPYGGRGRRPVARYPKRRSSLRQLVLAAGAQAATTVTWREDADGQQLASRFAALRVLPRRWWWRCVNATWLASALASRSSRTPTRRTRRSALPKMRRPEWPQAYHLTTIMRKYSP
jgi:SRSO17 transposase